MFFALSSDEYNVTLIDIVMVDLNNNERLTVPKSFVYDNKDRVRGYDFSNDKVGVPELIVTKYIVMGIKFYSDKGILRNIRNDSNDPRRIILSDICYRISGGLNMSGTEVILVLDDNLWLGNIGSMMYKKMNNITWDLSRLSDDKADKLYMDAIREHVFINRVSDWSLPVYDSRLDKYLALLLMWRCAPRIWIDQDMKIYNDFILEHIKDRILNGSYSGVGCVNNDLKSVNESEWLSRRFILDFGASVYDVTSSMLLLINYMRYIGLDEDVRRMWVGVVRDIICDM